MDREDALRRGLAELLGTGAFVFVASGAVVSIVATGTGTILTVAIAQGLALSVAITALGHISGAHLNPAVTFGFWVTGRITSRMAGVYVVCQLLGAVIAAVLVRGIFDDRFYNRADGGTTLLSGGVSVWEGLLFEIVATFVLVLVVFATAVDRRGAFKIVAGFAIGLTVATDLLVGGPLTGGSMNPARTFGPSLVSGEWADGWIYWIGPLIGGALGAGVYSALYLDRTPPEVIGRPGTGVEEAGVERAEQDV
jgi:MIP family channel proteins